MKKLAFIFTSIVVLGITSCSNNKNEEQNSEKLYVVATTGMVADMVKQVSGEKVEVEALMGEGVDPHLYKPSQSDLPKLRKANIIFYNGLHLEGKMTEILEKLGKDKPVYALSSSIPTSKLHLVEGTNTYDPHIWFDVSLWASTAPFVAQKLSEIDQKNASFYHQNAQSYQKQLDSLHADIQLQIQQIPQESRVLITAHDAFGYFGKAYQIEVRGLQGISTVSEFGVKDVTDLVDFIVSKKVKAVFVESSVASKSIEAVILGCQKKKHTVKLGGMLFSDAMGAKNSPEGTYVGMVKHNVRIIVNALK
ncbi:MAG: zinc ABC transporter substrate-binding protein [Flammeovirgaceae bacterium]